MQKAGKTPEKLTGTAATWVPSSSDDWDAKSVGVLKRREELGADVNGLQEMITYGIKGMSAYTAHAQLLGKESSKVWKCDGPLLLHVGLFIIMRLLNIDLLDFGSSLESFSSLHNLNDISPTGVRCNPIVTVLPG